MVFASNGFASIANASPGGVPPLTSNSAGTPTRKRLTEVGPCSKFDHANSVAAEMGDVIRIQ